MLATSSQEPVTMGSGAAGAFLAVSCRNAFPTEWFSEPARHEILAGDAELRASEAVLGCFSFSQGKAVPLAPGFVYGMRSWGLVLGGCCGRGQEIYVCLGGMSGAEEWLWEDVSAGWC